MSLSLESDWTDSASARRVVFNDVDADRFFNSIKLSLPDAVLTVSRNPYGYVDSVPKLKMYEKPSDCRERSLRVLFPVEGNLPQLRWIPSRPVKGAEFPAGSWQFESYAGPVVFLRWSAPYRIERFDREIVETLAKTDIMFSFRFHEMRDKKIEKIIWNILRKQCRSDFVGVIWARGITSISRTKYYVGKSSGDWCLHDRNRILSFEQQKHGNLGVIPRDRIKLDPS